MPSTSYPDVGSVKNVQIPRFGSFPVQGDAGALMKSLGSEKAAGAIKQAKIDDREVQPRDIVPTLAGILNIKPPRASTGKPLKEILADYSIGPP